MPSIQDFPFEQLEEIADYLVPEDSYKCTKCERQTLKARCEWRKTVSSFRLTCKIFASLRNPKAALLHTVHFFTSPKNLQKLEELSGDQHCASFVKRAVFHDPLFRSRFKDAKSYEEAVRKAVARGSRARLECTGLPHSQIEDCLNNILKRYFPYSDSLLRHGHEAYVMRLEQQESLLRKETLVESWAHVLINLPNIEHVWVSECDLDCSNKLAGCKQLKTAGFDWCTCWQNENPEASLSSLQKLHKCAPPILGKETEDRPEGGSTCMTLLFRALALSRPALRKLTVGPRFELTPSFDWRNLRGWASLDLSKLIKLDFSSNLLKEPIEQMQYNTFPVENGRLLALLKRMPALEIFVLRNDRLLFYEGGPMMSLEQSLSPKLKDFRLLNSVVSANALERFLSLHSNLNFIQLDSALAVGVETVEDHVRFFSTMRKWCKNAVIKMKDLWTMPEDGNFCFFPDGRSENVEREVCKYVQGKGSEEALQMRLKEDIDEVL
ncbi:MAG: hypothetical protein M1831_003078 [Alyxoria varia]|nr:MAG: hypothetical protein M1831_003078 [Alyxoria varia]